MAYQPQGYRTPQNRRRRKKGRRTIKILLLLAVLALVATLGVMGFTVYSSVHDVLDANTFYPGVYVDGIHLYGMQPMEAVEMLYSRASEAFRNWSLTLTLAGREWRIDADSLGMTHSLRSLVAEEVNRAFFVGRESNSLLSNYETTQALRKQPYVGYTGSISQNMGQVDGILQEIASVAYAAPQDASWRFEPTRKDPIVITDEVMGASVDVDALRGQIQEMVGTMTSGTIQVATQPISPQVTGATLRSQIVQLANFSTKIDRKSEDDRNRNIERGCDAFNGLVIEPGQRVSFNNRTGKRDQRNGWYPALEIVGGSYTMGYGGGICQVSSTMYNAVIQAGLKVVDRRNHGQKVGYLDMGMDATVYDDRIDFVFENNTGERIYMIAKVDLSSRDNRTCTVQFYGRPDPNGYSYALRVDPPIESSPIPTPTRKADTEQRYVVYSDQEQTVGGQPGYTVHRYLVTRRPDGSTFETALSTDTYKAVEPVTYYGTTPRW